MNKKKQAFTLVEIIVTVMMTGIIVGAAVILINSITNNTNSRSSKIDIALGQPTIKTIYGNNFKFTNKSIDTSKIKTGIAPNFPQFGNAMHLYSLLNEDKNKSSAVFILDRKSPSSYRPTKIEVPTDGFTSAIDTSQKFKDLIQSKSRNVFKDNGAMLSTSAHTSIFFLGLAGTEEALEKYIPVIAIYEIDIIAVNNLSLAPREGAYMTVRRFDYDTKTKTVLNSRESDMRVTAFYHAFYLKDPAINNDRAISKDRNLGNHSDGIAPHFFHPIYAKFNRNVIPPQGKTNNIGRKKPFYLLWLPDPSTHDLGGNLNSTIDGTTQFYRYGHKGGTTTFFKVIPTFPTFQ